MFFGLLVNSAEKGVKNDDRPRNAYSSRKNKNAIKIADRRVKAIRLLPQ
jgi:hypothetical protein